ncbi:glyoxalase I [Leptomonas pyrrhocoris]|uniref:Glyoxalase I n=1 Tax=Leptomonas pyrrhocoris TaxID=157538 RepID=A0A0M9GAJ7_LEPPY|nr:glyoxalase I [Leptomonas pyrrhocoris]XP_015664749.1 glyoxalase I [Leptomonas pyrrhocoris]XP_015664750.1 glyoxalase I [Leptomonas pyrrhocoris]KPA86309.1 glyoxalase I [Leptomonas pyrrhocoris]KPA86310.1 glyoxalase I [Leptomonas pyrrhocoris]KPA86311.1 glyoxalase I [Leptomonas pyrrhocoris]|eukprot:XP_015664748.1 glyoxalase I [Leptomonas pyrrhocoris]
MRLLHSMLRVGDLDRSVKFYTECLKMKEMRRRECPEEKYTVVFLGYDKSEEEGPTIELTYNYDVTSYTHGEAFGHIAIGVEDVKELVAELRAKNVTIDYEKKDGYMAFIVDPDGYYIELLNEKMVVERARKAMQERGKL